MLYYHNNAVMPVSAEARGRCRELSSQLEATSARMTAALARVPAGALKPWTWKGPIGRERAIAKIAAAIPATPQLRTRETAIWRFVQPTTALPDPDEEVEARAGFIVMGIIAGPKKRLVRVETFGAGFSKHSIGRLLDRSGFRVDPLAAMFDAHAALTRLDPEDGERIFDLRKALMPAGGGAFLGTAGRFGPDASPLMIGKTWLSADQLRGANADTLGAWHELLTTA